MDDTVREISNKLASQYMSKIPQGKINKTNDFIFLENIISEVSDLIFNITHVYYNQLVQKLNDPKTSSKTCWSISKAFIMTKRCS